MQVSVNIENANHQLIDTLSAVLKSFRDVKFKIDKKVDYSKLEKEILESEKELQEQRKNGTLKTFNDVDEMFEDILND